MALASILVASRGFTARTALARPSISARTAVRTMCALPDHLVDMKEELESGEPGPLLVQLELVPSPLKGAWVPREHEVQRALAIHAESGGKLLTPRGGGVLSTPRGGAGGVLNGLGGMMSPRMTTPRGGLGLSTPRQGAAAPSAAPAVGLW